MYARVAFRFSVCFVDDISSREPSAREFFVILLYLCIRVATFIITFEIVFSLLLIITSIKGRVTGFRIPPRLPSDYSFAFCQFVFSKLSRPYAI